MNMLGLHSWFWYKLHAIKYKITAISTRYTFAFTVPICCFRTYTLNLHASNIPFL